MYRYLVCEYYRYVSNEMKTKVNYTNTYDFEETDFM